MNVLTELKQRKRTAKDEVHRLLDTNVIKATRRYLREPVFLATKQERAVVATFIALCHVTPLSVITWAPYMGVHNSAGAGKSTLGNTAAALAGGTVSGGHTAASMYRWLDDNIGYLFVADEGERMLRGARKESFEEILLNGNDIDRSISRGRPGSKTAGSDTYRVFGPKMIISIRGADESTALGRRIITIEMKEPPVTEFSSLRIKPLEEVLRAKLKSWAKVHADEIRARYQHYNHSPTYGAQWVFGSQAQRQLWSGMLAVADVAGLTDLVAEYCRTHERTAQRRIDSPLEDALKGLLDTLAAGRYRYPDLLSRLRRQFGAHADRWSEEKIGRVMRKRPHPRVAVRDRDGHGAYVILSGTPTTGSPQPDISTMAASVAAAVAAVTQGNVRGATRGTATVP